MKEQIVWLIVQAVSGLGGIAVGALILWWRK